MICSAPTTIVNEEAIAGTLRQAAAGDASRIREAIARARELKGLEAADVAALMSITRPELLEELFAAARYAKDEIYGSRLVLFAPLYVSNYCRNECAYCAFRVKNRGLARRALAQAEIANEVRILIEQGHKRLLLVAGESYPEPEGLDYILRSIDTVYATKSQRGEIRRVNVNIAPLSTDDFRRLKARNIGTYQLFQETYHRATYRRMHTAGLKKDFDWRISAFDRAMEAGIDDVGVGVLFGLYDWKFEILALLQHIRHLEAKFGVGPHTISVPRIEPAAGSAFAEHPEAPVSDSDFCKIVAILRLTVPYTGLIMSTRETPEIRRRTFEMGVSQISAGSRTNPGGYAELGEGEPDAQFQLGDHRSLDEVVRDVASMGYIPSFCTACYRLGRTGSDFMDLARPGLIKCHCGPNAIASFQEYLMDYASPQTRTVGEKMIQDKLNEMNPRLREITGRMLRKLQENHRDVYI